MTPRNENRPAARVGEPHPTRRCALWLAAGLALVALVTGPAPAFAASITVGLTVDVGATGMLFIDYQQINYEDVDAVSNSIDNLDACGAGDIDSCLGGSDGAGFGWEDMQIVKLGYQWKTGKNTWRVGYSTTDQPMPEDEVTINILAPGVVEEHFTFGFTRELDAKSAINFAAMYAPSVSVKGANTFDPAQEVEIEMDQYELAFSYSRRL